MVDRIYKIGDFVKIIKPKHFCFGNIGRVLKINKNSLIISGDDKCDEEIVIISKKYVELYKKIPLKLEMMPLGKKKQSLDYYMKKAFLTEDFEDFVLFNYMRTFTYKSKLVKGEYVTIPDSNLLDIKIRNKKIISSNYTRCVFFTPIPTKFFAKYFSEELIKHYSQRNVFICLDGKVLCNIPKNYWIGFNSDWDYGPHSFQDGEPIEDNRFYALDSCDTKPKMNKSFLDFFTEQLTIKLKESHLRVLGNDIGLTVYLKESYEDKFINFIRKKGAELFLNMEIFVCNSNWMDYSSKTTLRFKKEDVLIANYEKETVEDNIKKLLNI
jgi:hypothetical protein